MEDQLVPIEDNIETCKNCEKQFEKGFEYCPHCGQKTNEELTLKDLFYNTISNYFSFDARFFRSFIPLMFKPGYVARQFVEGKRLQYLHPAQYYLFISVVFFFLFSFKVREYNSAIDKVLEKGFEIKKNDTIPEDMVAIDSIDVASITSPIIKSSVGTGIKPEELEKLDSIIKSSTDSLNTKIASSKNNTNLDLGYDDKKLDSLIAAGASEEEQLKVIGLEEGDGFIKKAFYKQVLKFHKQQGGGIVQAFFDTIPIALFFLLPIFAMIMKLFYWRRGRFAHHLVFSFYYFSFLFVVLSAVLLLNYIWDIPDWIDWLVVLSTFIYLWLSMKHFYKQGYFLTLIKSGFATFIYMMFILPLALIIISLSSLLFY